MYPQNLNDFPNLNNPPPDSLLGTKYLNPDYLFDRGVDVTRTIFTMDNLSFLKTLMVLLSIFFISLICYCAIRLFEIRRKEHHHLEHEIREYAERQRERERKAEEKKGMSSNPAWVKVVEHLLSGNANEWKLAVIEADIMLDGMLTQMGFKGDTLGDKLKSANQDTFKNLSTAWEVHTIRNKIAHQGSAFELSLHEARRVASLYEQIFRGYGFI